MRDVGVRGVERALPPRAREGVGPVHQLTRREVARAGRADARALVLVERSRGLEVEGAGEQRAVPNAGMCVERQVGGVDRDVMGQQQVQAIPGRARDPLEPAPEHAVVQHEHVGAARDRGLDGAAREVDRRGDDAHRPAVLELQPVERRGIVREPRHAEQRVEEGGDVVGGGHA